MKFIALVLISSTIHTSFLLYISFVFLNINDKKTLVKCIVIGITFMVCITILNNNYNPFINMVLNFIRDEKIYVYLSSHTNIGYFIPIFLHGTSIALIFWSKKINAKKLINRNIYEFFRSNFIDLIYWINIMAIIFFPLFIMNLQFYRLVRNILILNFLVYSLSLHKLSNKKAYKYLFNFFVIISLILWGGLDLIVKTDINRVLIPFFTKNYFLN